MKTREIHEDRDGRLWRVTEDPAWLQLEGQDDQPLFHTVEHVTSEFGPLKKRRTLTVAEHKAAETLAKPEVAE